MWCRTLPSVLTFSGGLVLGVVIALFFFLSYYSSTPSHGTGPLLLAEHDFSSQKKHLPKQAPYRNMKTFEFGPDNMESKRFLDPKFAPKPPKRPFHLEQPGHLREEYRLRKTIFVGVLSSQMYLPTRAKAMFDTWGQDVSMLAFFVGEDCVVPPELSHLPVIKLPGVPDGVYPPLKKAFAVVKYMYEHYVNDYNWFIRADDDFYLRGRPLSDLLNSMDAGEMIQLGRAGEGREKDSDRLKLLKHEKYCMGGPGMIFSRGMMVALGPYLDLCLNALMYHDSKNPDFPWNDDDVEIGRCISRELNVQCSTSHEGRQYFYTDYTGDSLDAKKLWTQQEFRDIITIHPIKDPRHIHSLHLFYRTLEYEELYVKKQAYEHTITSLCNTLPSKLVPPSFSASQCAIEFGTSHYYDEETRLKGLTTTESSKLKKKKVRRHRKKTY